MKLYEFGGTGEVLNFAVANGFPPETYIPFLRPFTQRYRVVCVLPRALWDDAYPPETYIDWREGLARDLLDGLRAHNLENVIALGHSFGGIASLLCAIAERERFKSLILLDPTILSPEIMHAADAARAEGMYDTPLAIRADKRQRDFHSVDDAYAFFKSKRLFQDWDDESVRIYAEHGTQPTENGVTLRWKPEWEAYYFRTIYTNIWETLPRLRGLLPTFIIRGGDSDTFLESSAERVRQMLPDIDYAEIAGHGHLFPHSAPQHTAELVMNWLAEGER